MHRPSQGCWTYALSHLWSWIASSVSWHETSVCGCLPSTAELDRHTQLAKDTATDHDGLATTIQVANVTQTLADLHYTQLNHRHLPISAKCNSPPLPPSDQRLQCACVLNLPTHQNSAQRICVTHRSAQKKLVNDGSAVDGAIFKNCRNAVRYPRTFLTLF